ncbi:MAG: peptidylprolyl isomerase [Planctomycetota bacterium]|jgi:cyclophilin family peptidyl-prolyl cis-trans isomerase
MKVITILLGALAIAVVTTGCGGGAEAGAEAGGQPVEAAKGTESAPPSEPPATAPKPEPAPPPVEPYAWVVLETSMGDIVLRLDRERAPISVENFLGYVTEGFYDGTIFHRVLPNFVIQGGGFNPGMQKKTPGPPIVNEWTNGLKNLRGTISMARMRLPDSATCQFFISVKDNPSLDQANAATGGAGYAVFGEVVSGMDVADRIRHVPTGTSGRYGDVPIEEVVLVTATALTAEQAQDRITRAEG